MKKRKKGAEEPIKFMGCGDCETMSRSMTVIVNTDTGIVCFFITSADVNSCVLGQLCACACCSCAVFDMQCQKFMRREKAR